MDVAIIPARGGSKRIPRKNIKDFCGKPMISYSINAALNSGAFDEVIVSTDDDEIRSLALKLGATVPFQRPENLADDFTPTVPVIAHAISACENLEWDINFVACIYATAPFISKTDLLAGKEIVKNIHNKYCFPVAEFPSSVHRALTINNAECVKPMFPKNELTRTQDLQQAYFDVGQFYWAHKSTWLSNSNIHLDASVLVIPKWRAVDIDDLEDWKRAEKLYKISDLN